MQGEHLGAGELLRLIFDRTDAVRMLWNFYIVVALGVLGFMARAASWPNGRRIGRVAAFGFSVFAVMVAASMLQTLGERAGLVSILRSLDLPPSYESLDEAIIIWPAGWVLASHLVLGLTVIFIILWLGRQSGPGPVKESP